MLPPAAKTGDVLKAEADFEWEGINIVSVIPPKTDARSEPARIEVIGPPRGDTPGVTTQLVGRSDRRPNDRKREGGDNRPPRQDRAGGRPPSGRDSGRPNREGGAGNSEARPRRRPEGEGPRPDRVRTDRPRTDRAGSEPGAVRPPRAGRPASGGDRAGRTDAGAADRQKGRRLTPGHAHRTAVMESLPPEQRPIAEQVLRGGIPAVRTALHLEREKAEAEGRAVPNTDELVAMAEALLPKLRAAEWRDRAEAAVADAGGISLRDLRSVVAGGDSARDDETRALGATLREALETRIAKLHSEWAAEIAKHLAEGRAIRALRLSARPPEPSARLDAELSANLASAAGEAMSPSTSSDLWAALLDAVAASPVRRQVKPVGLPEDAPPELKRAAHQHSGTIPALAKMLGVAIPPPPLPSPGRRPGADRSPAPDRSRGRGPRPARPAPTEATTVASPAPAGLGAAPEPASLDAAPVREALEATPERASLDAAPVREALEAAPEPASLDAAPVREALEAAPQPAALEAPPVPAALEAIPVPAALEAASDASPDTAPDPVAEDPAGD